MLKGKKKRNHIKCSIKPQKAEKEKTKKNRIKGQEQQTENSKKYGGC